MQVMIKVSIWRTCLDLLYSVAMCMDHVHACDSKECSVYATFTHSRCIYLHATCNCVMDIYTYVMFVCVHVQPMHPHHYIVGKDYNQMSMGKANQMAA